MTSSKRRRRTAANRPWPRTKRRPRMSRSRSRPTRSRPSNSPTAATRGLAGNGGPLFLSGGRDAEHGVRAGTPPRRECRGRLPPLSVQRLSPRPLLARRRRRQHARQQPVRSPARTRSGPGRCGQMDRRRDRRAWRSARPDRRQPQDRCHARRARRGATVLEPPGAGGRADRSRQHRPDRPKRHGACLRRPSRSSARSPRRICGNAASRLCGIARRCASTRAATTARTAQRRPERAQTGRRSSQPSPTSTAR